MSLYRISLINHFCIALKIAKVAFAKEICFFGSVFTCRTFVLLRVNKVRFSIVCNAPHLNRDYVTGTSLFLYELHGFPKNITKERCPQSTG